MGLLNPHLETSAMKKIACGNVQEHIESNEAITSFEVVREEMFTMALFSQAECNKLSSKGTIPMDISAVIEKVKEGFTKEFQGHESSPCPCHHPHAAEVNVYLGGLLKK